MPERPMSLGGYRGIDGRGETRPLAIPPHHLTTHAAVVGMTGSGKTGMVMVLVEEALRSGVPCLVVDVKGDLPNLLLTFPTLSAAEFAPWVDEAAAAREGRTVTDVAAERARAWRDALAESGLGADDVAALRAAVQARVITPGASAGESLNVLSGLEPRGEQWTADTDGAREALTATVSLLLRLLGRDADPARSREHVLLSVLAERRLRAGQSAGIERLLEDLAAPPVERVGEMAVDAFVSPRERHALATGLNALVASPTFASWRQGGALDVAGWMAAGTDGRVPLTVLSVAHLDDEERALVLGVVLEHVLAWVRGLSGTSALRGLVVFDEVSGYAPPHPANPATKRPLLGLMKQARAFGVGMVLATQDPMDVDYRVLGNAGLWLAGRLQTDADRQRVVEGMASSGRAGEAGVGAGAGIDARAIAARVKVLAPRWFVMRDAHAGDGVKLVQSRCTLAWMRGPMTRREIARLR